MINYYFVLSGSDILLLVMINDLDIYTFKYVDNCMEESNPLDNRAITYSISQRPWHDKFGLAKKYYNVYTGAYPDIETKKRFFKKVTYKGFLKWIHSHEEEYPKIIEAYRCSMLPI